jgi:hypothetical protein
MSEYQWEVGDDSGESWTRENLAALITQLHYDRADVARLSGAAASAMDIVIAEATSAAERLLAVTGLQPLRGDL